jgi:hypothetical protein
MDSKEKFMAAIDTKTSKKAGDNIELVYHKDKGITSVNFMGIPIQACNLNDFQGAFELLASLGDRCSGEIDIDCNVINSIRVKAMDDDARDQFRTGGPTALATSVNCRFSVEICANRRVKWGWVCGDETLCD